MGKLNIVFTGGGTGGHLYPAIAIAQALGDRANVAFIGSADRLEAKIVPQAGYPLITVRSGPRTRPFANVAGVFQALGALRKLRPDIVIATGGYVGLPVVLAARILGKRIALLEPNAHPGLTNRMLSPLVDEVWGAFAQPDKRFASNMCTPAFRCAHRCETCLRATRRSNAWGFRPNVRPCSRWVEARAPDRSTTRLPHC